MANKKEYYKPELIPFLGFNRILAADLPVPAKTKHIAGCRFRITMSDRPRGETVVFQLQCFLLKRVPVA